jgi:hypothetical protein
VSKNIKEKKKMGKMYKEEKRKKDKRIKTNYCFYVISTLVLFRKSSFHKKRLLFDKLGMKMIT